jgi:glycosyltransferase involved in cell wall biosynthesis
MSPTISCIIPLYNAAEYLAEPLDSVLTQSRKLDEIIVVDDRSTDASYEVASRLSDHVRFVRQDKQGPAAARDQACV